jgi:hypothetical protein
MNPANLQHNLGVYATLFGAFACISGPLLLCSATRVRTIVIVALTFLLWALAGYVDMRRGGLTPHHPFAFDADAISYDPRNLGRIWDFGPLKPGDPNGPQGWWQRLFAWLFGWWSYSPAT